MKHVLRVGRESELVSRKEASYTDFRDPLIVFGEPVGRNIDRILRNEKELTHD